jgi:hypothetical protein
MDSLEPCRHFLLLSGTRPGLISAPAGFILFANADAAFIGSDLSHRIPSHDLHPVYDCASDDPGDGGLILSCDLLEVLRDGEMLWACIHAFSAVSA